MPQFVKLVNTDDVPFDFHQNNLKRIIPPGRDTIVPWDVAVSLFGDPYLVDLPRAPERTKSLKQARGNFNYMLGMEQDAEFEARRPHIHAYDIETDGQRIYMLIDDPEGVRGAPAPEVANNQSDMEILMRQNANLQRQIDQILMVQQAQMAQRPDGQVVVVSNDTAPAAPTVTAVNGNPINLVAPDGTPLQTLKTDEQIAVELTSEEAVEAARFAQFMSGGMGAMPDEFAPADEIPLTPANPEVLKTATTDGPAVAARLAPRPA